MKRRIVLKRLSESDLTLFEHHYRHTSGAKQKAFNLDRAVFIDQLYPSLPEQVGLDKDRFPIDLHIYGPGLAGLYNLQRKILKQQKNWRLNGELIHNPPDSDSRFNILQKNDFAIFDFTDGYEPRVAHLYLVARAIEVDTKLHTALDTHYSPKLSSRKSMEVLDPGDFAELIHSQFLVQEHPLLDMIDSPLLEDAAQGGIEGIRQLRKRRGGRGIKRDELERAKKAAAETGRLGEELLNTWLDDQEASGNIPGFAWDADYNAVSPFDFTIRDGDLIQRSIDAKSTTGSFDNKIHVSLAELYEMRDGGRPYDLYRLYDVKNSSAKLRIALDLSGFSEGVIDALQGLPEGVRIDSVSIEPGQLSFGEEQLIDVSEEPSVKNQEKTK